MHYNRKQRRQIARQFEKALSQGAGGIVETKEEAAERKRRVAAAGKSIEMQFLQDVENSIRNQDADIEAKVLNSLIEAHGEERGRAMMEENRRLAEKKKNKRNRIK